MFFGNGAELKVKKSVAKNWRWIISPALMELMKKLFNVETYRAAMIEFEINMSERPLGKLRKSNIQKGFEALTEIQNLLSDTANDPSMEESLIIAAKQSVFYSHAFNPSTSDQGIRMINDTANDPSMKESLIIAAKQSVFYSHTFNPSTRTVIPSIHPHVIKDKDEFK